MEYEWREGEGGQVEEMSIRHRRGELDGGGALEGRKEEEEEGKEEGKESMSLPILERYDERDCCVVGLCLGCVLG